MIMKHSYATNITRTGATGAISTYVFSANGLFDPDITGTGHQPAYFDKMTAIYNHYTVLSSKISVTMMCMPANAAESIEVCLNQGDTASSSFSTLANCREQPYCSFVLVPGSISTAVVSIPPNSNKIGLGFNAFKVFGSRALSDPNLRGDSSSNPTEQNYYYLSHQDANLAKSAQLSYMVTIDYVAEWTELRQELLN